MLKAGRGSTPNSTRATTTPKALVQEMLQGERFVAIHAARAFCGVARIMHGFGCKIIAHDAYQNPDCLELGVEYCKLPSVPSFVTNAL